MSAFISIETGLVGGKLNELMPPSIADDPEIIAMNHALAVPIQSAASDIRAVVVLPKIGDQFTGPTEAVYDALARNWNLHLLSFWDDLDVTSKREALTGIMAHMRRSGTVGAVKKIFAILRIEAHVVEWWQESVVAHRYRIVVDGTGSSPYHPSAQIPPWITEWCGRFGRLSQLLTGVS